MQRDADERAELRAFPRSQWLSRLGQCLSPMLRADGNSIARGSGAPPLSLLTRSAAVSKPAATMRRLSGRLRGRSSDGRALQSHCRGQGFDSPRLHHPSSTAVDFLRFFSAIPKPAGILSAGLAWSILSAMKLPKPLPVKGALNAVCNMVPPSRLATSAPSLVRDGSGSKASYQST